MQLLPSNTGTLQGGRPKPRPPTARGLLCPEKHPQKDAILSNCSGSRPAHRQSQPLKDHRLTPKDHCLCLGDPPQLSLLLLTAHASHPAGLGSPSPKPLRAPRSPLQSLCCKASARLALSSYPTLTSCLGSGTGRACQAPCPPQAGPLLPPEGISFPCTPQRQGRHPPAPTDSTESHAAAEV